MSFEQAMRIPIKLLLPLLGELLRRDVNVDQVLNCPGGRLPLEALLHGDMAALDRPDFIHAYGLCTRLLVQTICRQEARTDTLDRMIKPFLAFVITGNTLHEAANAPMNSMSFSNSTVFRIASKSAAIRPILSST